MKDNIFWEYLETLPEQTAAWCEWRNHLGRWDKFSVFCKKYLQLEMLRARTVECIALCKHDCPREVIENSPHDITAVCPRGRTRPYSLKFQDILLYSLDLTKFHQALCNALELKPCSGETWILSNIWQLGEYSFKDDEAAYPVCLTIPASPEEMTDTIEQLCALHQTPFILLALTGRQLSAEASRLLTRHKAIFLTPSDVLTFNGDGTFKLKKYPNLRHQENRKTNNSTQQLTEVTK